MKMIKMSLAKTLIVIGLFVSSLTASAQYEKLLDFDGTNGKSAYGSLLLEGANLYGMTQLGGANSKGVIFKMNSDGTGYSQLFDFDGLNNGAFPKGALISDGTYLYGMAMQGGDDNKGVVFKIKFDGTSYTKLLDFDGVNGESPYGSLVSDGSFLYGMTYSGGVNGFGVIFKIKTDGTGYSKLLDFDGAVNGQSPNGSLTLIGTDLYGTTANGGDLNFGLIFKIKTDGTGYTKIVDFDGVNKGRSPFGSLVSDGTNLYGVTSSGGVNNLGVVFKVKPDGSDYQNLLDFNGFDKGQTPSSSLIISGAHLYGVTLSGGANSNGVMFKIKPDGSDFTKLVEFDGANEGESPNGALASDGSSLYGMTVYGGANNFGVVYKYDHCTPSAKTVVKEACHSYTWPLNNVTYTESTNTATVTLVNAIGCDSVVTLDLTIEKIDATVDVTSHLTLTVNESGATYQWLDCDNGDTPISGENGQSFTSDTVGNYAVIVTVGACTKTSDCMSNSGLGLNEQMVNNISIYPNPTNGWVTIDLAHNSLVNYTVTTIEGKVIQSGNTSNSAINIDLGSEESGIYFINIHREGVQNVFKIVRQ